ncbi:Menaquinone biosynthesis methyltransferase [Histomonas meleagridis]|uniref:Menaquinone biosynthesis methyltransferase n=1 Tax=Histomonas meleagridis TaxID=135588 RepID=UPI00355AC9B0|nr:Menaquinone biosynthesis methyltransferase [Histomonas meleagridis]KAH0807154.1 Menaquinone biosynthesis methyltransferase [Histomonas meleagridis]
MSFKDPLFEEENLDQELENILNHPAPAYGEMSYWNSRYEKTKGEVFEWFQPWTELRIYVQKYLGNGGVALNIGCGNSKMSADLLSSLITKVISIDFSDVVINQMKQKYQDEKRLEWQTSSCTQMKFQSNTFEYVFDKGTIDTLLCADNSIKQIDNSLKEIARVLKPGGYLISVSYGLPSTRKHFFNNPSLGLNLIDSITVEKPPFPNHYIYVIKKND